METPRKFITAELSIRKLCNNKFTWCFHQLNKYIVFTMQTYKKLNVIVPHIILYSSTNACVLLLLQPTLCITFFTHPLRYLPGFMSCVVAIFIKEFYYCIIIYNMLLHLTCQSDGKVDILSMSPTSSCI